MQLNKYIIQKLLKEHNINTLINNQEIIIDKILVYTFTDEVKKQALEKGGELFMGAVFQSKYMLAKNRAIVITELLRGELRC